MKARGREYYKVLTQKMESLGLLGARRLHYNMRRWTRPEECLSRHPMKGGGLWVVRNLGSARQVRKYMNIKHGIETRIFLCRIDGILFSTRTE